MSDAPLIQVTSGDIRAFKADVLALKYAQRRFGVDALVARDLQGKGVDVDSAEPAPGKFVVLDSKGAVGADKVLFAGVVRIKDFSYGAIRQFSRSVLEQLTTLGSGVSHVALTLHGTGYWLDEQEALKAELAGLLEAVLSGKAPASLSKVSIVELDSARVARLRDVLSSIFPAGRLDGHARSDGQTAAERLRVATQLTHGNWAFVAMPFSSSAESRYHQAIAAAVHETGFLCERADKTAFVGDVMSWVEGRIRGASFVVADLTGANPNVYLELGYAWGVGKPVVLVASGEQDLMFNVRSEKCVMYDEVAQLRRLLNKELKQLRADGVF